MPRSGTKQPVTRKYISDGSHLKLSANGSSFARIENIMMTYILFSEYLPTHQDFGINENSKESQYINSLNPHSKNQLLIESKQFLLRTLTKEEKETFKISETMIAEWKNDIALHLNQSYVTVNLC